MTRTMAVVAILLGIVQVPLGLSWHTSWMLPLAHLLMCVLVTPLGLLAALAGRPLEARAWGLWTVLATAGGMVSIHHANWAVGGWSWLMPYITTLAWAWIPVAVAWVGGPLGHRRAWQRARRAVASRHRTHAVTQAIHAAAEADQNRVG